MKRRSNFIAEEDEIKRIIEIALAEDIGSGDITTKLLPEKAKVEAEIYAKEKGVIAGLRVAQQVFETVDARVRFRALKRDGERVKKGERVAEIIGPGTSILTGERTALNFLSHLSGVASLTAEFVKRVSGTSTWIFDTRKTTPGLRILEKYAVRIGGGVNHRQGLYDGILIKDNHISLLVSFGGFKRRTSAITYLVSKAKAVAKEKGLPVEIEVENEREAERAAGAGAEIILLDNLPPEKVLRIRRNLKKKGFKGEIEVSGGVTLDNVTRYARAGVERISIGRLTHSAPALDFSLEIKWQKREFG